MKRLLLTGLPLMLLLAFFSQCKKEKSDDEYRNEEKVKLDKYLVDNNIPQSSLKGGIYYLPDVVGSGDTILQGDYVLMNLTGSLLDKTVFASTDSATAKDNNIYDTYNIYGPVKIKMDTTAVFEKGIMRGITMMKKGGKATFIIPSDYAYQGQTTSIIPKFSTLLYKVEILEVIKNPETFEKQKIHEYLLSHPEYVVDSTSSAGIYHIQLVAGNNTVAKPVDGNSVTFEYTGRYLDGRIYACTSAGTSATLTLGQGLAPVGVENSIKSMRKGEKARFIIPYSLGYGAQTATDSYGYIRVPAYTTILMDITLTDIQ
jgi:FKBP-type peptidyl-prolyl cis-trans isomerase